MINDIKCNKSKVLPFRLPEISPWSYNSHILSILSAYGDNYLQWFYSNFLLLQISQGNSKNDHIITYVNLGCPFLSEQKINRNTVSAMGVSIIQFLKKCIDLNYYAYLFIDQYYIPKYINYQKAHFEHDPVVFGYDDEKKVFHAADFILNKEEVLKYGTMEISYSEMEEAYENLPSNKDHINGFLLYQYNNTNIELNMDLIKLSLKDYLNSSYTFELTKSEPNKSANGDILRYTYGLEIYQIIDNFIKEELNHPVHEDSMIIDHRWFYIINTHKRIMLARIQLLIKTGYLCNDFEAPFTEILKLSDLLKNMIYKYLLSNNIKHLLKAQQLLSQLEELEKINLTTISSLLEKN